MSAMTDLSRSSSRAGHIRRRETCGVRSVPASLPPEHAAFIEPLSCSIHAIQRGQIGLEDVVVIAGCGPLGLGMVAAARLRHPRLLIALDLNDHRLNVALACGADMTLNLGRVDEFSS